MSAEHIPWPVVVLCIATGVLMIGLGIPLALRRVPPNSTYGVRFLSTMADESVWYEINARGGRHLIFLGTLFIAVFVAVLASRPFWSVERRVLGPLAVLVVGLVVDAIVLGVSAKRLLDRRRTPGVR